MNMPAENVARQRELFYKRIASKNLKPLWEALHSLVPECPQPKCIPVMWKYAELRAPLLEAGDLISAQQATAGGRARESGICGRFEDHERTLRGGAVAQPGEVAPATATRQSAIRFVLEGEGAYTAVEGERTAMRPGDFILTPSGTFHDHGNPGNVPVMWLDGLDVPIVNLFDAGFGGTRRGQTNTVARSEGDALARYGANMLPVEYEPRRPLGAGLLLPVRRSREALETLRGTVPIDPCHGQDALHQPGDRRISHADDRRRSFSCCRRDSAGRRRAPPIRRSYSVAEGRGRSRVGDTIFAWAPRDIFVVPSWMPCTHESDATSVLFSYSDRVVQEQLGLWRG